MGNLGCCNMNRALCWLLWPLNVKANVTVLSDILWLIQQFLTPDPHPNSPPGLERENFQSIKYTTWLKKSKQDWDIPIWLSPSKADGGECSFLIHLNLTATFSTVEQIQNHLLETVMVAGSLPVQPLHSWVCGVPVCIRFKCAICENMKQFKCINRWK